MYVTITRTEPLNLDKLTNCIEDEIIRHEGYFTRRDAPTLRKLIYNKIDEYFFGFNPSDGSAILEMDDILQFVEDHLSCEALKILKIKEGKRG